MGFLYLRPDGKPHHKHSYSAGTEWEGSPLKYKLHRIDGWREKDNKGSFKFGRAFESALQFHHENGLRGGIEEFQRLWAEHKDDKEITYTKTEKDWESLDRCGREMMKLYIAKLPSLPIPKSPIFQREFEKEVFPGHEIMGGITFAGKLDIIGEVSSSHPMLPAPPAGCGPEREIIIDVKTSGLDFHERPGMCAYDAQLRTYSWLRGIRLVAFLWFKKTGHNVQKASSVSFLADTKKFSAGDEAIVAMVVKDPAFGDQAYVVKNDAELELMEQAQGRKLGKDGKSGALETTKEADARKLAWLKENAELVDLEFLTRQRLQFNAGEVKDKYAEDAGFVVGRQITEIVNAWKMQYWPMEFGVKFPRDSSKDSYFRAFIQDDKLFREQYFQQAGDDAFDDLLVPDEDPEEDQVYV